MYRRHQNQQFKFYLRSINCMLFNVMPHTL